MRIVLLGLAAALLLPAASAEAQLFAAVLPSSRSVQVGTPATAFATVINASASTAHACRLTLPPGLPVTFMYQTTDSKTNQPTGTANMPVDIPAGSAQSFMFALTPIAGFSSDVALVFGCADAGPAAVVAGLNTLRLTASVGAVPDVIAIAVTPTNDGIVAAPGAFAVAAVNVGARPVCSASGFVCRCVGAGFEVTASGAVPATMCETNPLTGQCWTPPAPSLTLAGGLRSLTTLSVFMTGSAEFDPAINRVNVTFRQYSDVVFHPFNAPCDWAFAVTRVYQGERGSTSIAVSPP